MIVNEMKTKVMVYGSTSRNITVKFHDKILERVDQYKYLGNLVKSVKKCNEDKFGENYQYLYSKARQAIFTSFKRLKHIGTLPAHIRMYLFELLVKPVLVYGSEIWGTIVNATKYIDKVLLWYARAILRVKSNTSNLITLGQCGVISPSVACHKQLLCYFKRLKNICKDTLVKKVYNELNVLDSLDFSTWISSVCTWPSITLQCRYERRTEHGIIQNSTKLVEKHYVSKWQTELMEHEKHHTLRTLCII